MPFDVVVGDRTLHDVAVDLGLEPIPLAELEAYKRDMLAKHSGNWVYRHRYLMQALVPLSFLSAILLLLKAPLPISILAGMTMLLVAGALSNLRMRYPARWVEYAGLTSSIPTPILENIARLTHWRPNTMIVVGDLLENVTSLDPYVVLLDLTTGDRICMGIWDGNRIIRQA